MIKPMSKILITACGNNYVVITTRCNEFWLVLKREAAMNLMTNAIQPKNLSFWLQPAQHNVPQLAIRDNSHVESNSGKKGWQKTDEKHLQVLLQSQFAFSFAFPLAQWCCQTDWNQATFNVCF